MTDYVSPGVCVEEVQVGKPIEWVSTSTAAFIGETACGPVRPTRVTSVADYERWFGGGLGENKYLPDAVVGFFENGGQRLFVCRVASLNATEAEATFGPFLTVRAAGPGSWGTRVYAKIDDGTAQIETAEGPKSIGFRLRLAYYATEPIDDPLDWFNGIPGSAPPDHSEDFEMDEAAPDHWSRYPQQSKLAVLIRTEAAHDGVRPENGFARLTGGLDGSPVLTAIDFEGEAIAPRQQPQGLAALALEPDEDVAIVYAPGVTLDVAKRVVEHCERSGSRFAIVDAESAPWPPGFEPASVLSGSRNAALYYPWIDVSSPLRSPPTKRVPPGGHVAGIYARSDGRRGVHKAPAGEVVLGAVGVAKAVTTAEQQALEVLHVNVIREFPGRGILVWGARTLSDDQEWKYISVRRLLIFLERSIWKGTQWAVFEPNDATLWAKIAASITNFLLTVWRNGALQGVTAEKAFYVRCDQSTMSQSDIDSGRLICEIGVAPVRPAEFIVFRISHMMASA